MDTLQQINSLLDNDNVATVTSVIIALYAGMAAPALPDSVVLFFDTVVGKLLFLFLIGFVASRNIKVALMVAVAFVVTLHVVNQRTTERYFNYQRAMLSGAPLPQEKKISDFTVNVDEHFDHPLAEDISPKDTFGNPEQPEDYISPKDTFANPEQPEDYISPKDTFRNYSLEHFNSTDMEPPLEGPGAVENLKPDDEMDDFQPTIEETGGNDLEETDVEETDVEGFYSNINPSVRNLGVNPANNTAGSSNHMFAPVQFN